jgi:hypothetical protein
MYPSFTQDELIPMSDMVHLEQKAQIMYFTHNLHHSQIIDIFWHTQLNVVAMMLNNTIVPIRNEDIEGDLTLSQVLCMFDIVSSEDCIIDIPDINDLEEISRIQNKVVREMVATQFKIYHHNACPLSFQIEGQQDQDEEGDIIVPRNLLSSFEREEVNNENHDDEKGEPEGNNEEKEGELDEKEGDEENEFELPSLINPRLCPLSSYVSDSVLLTEQIVFPEMSDAMWSNAEDCLEHDFPQAYPGERFLVYTSTVQSSIPNYPSIRIDYILTRTISLQHWSRIVVAYYRVNDNSPYIYDYNYLNRNIAIPLPNVIG